jgi:hypothetical protein
MGCKGNFQGKYIICNSVENYLFEVSNDELSMFLDKTCKMFDRIIDDYNEISNILNFINKKFNVFSEQDLFFIQNFLIMHKKCGLFIMLKVNKGVDL